MIALTIPAMAEGQARFVTRLNRYPSGDCQPSDSFLVSESGNRHVYSGEHGVFELVAVDEVDFDGDVVVVDPRRGSAERLIRAGSIHNTFLVTERCDQLCVMCSQPPKKTHVDRFAEFTSAALLAPENATIGISGGEPTLFKNDLFSLIEAVKRSRPDLSFHILSNGQHFDESDRERLAAPPFRDVTWGIPLYSHTAARHDAIVKKPGAYDRLLQSFTHLLMAGSQVELRTVVLQDNLPDLPALARFVTTHLGFVVQWSIMQLENIGFAKNRFANLYVNPRMPQDSLYDAIDIAELFGVSVSLFNFPRCTVKAKYRRYAVASISDWKRKYAPACNTCRERSHCSGFFEWHPERLLEVNPL
jgi:His-Xaa-Ser system radical SAM maturase HxsC